MEICKQLPKRINKQEEDKKLYAEAMALNSFDLIASYVQKSKEIAELKAKIAKYSTEKEFAIGAI